jgi:hypothetical protein
MAWKRSYTSDLEWDSAINGVTWYRRRELRGYQYYFLIFDDEELPEDLKDAAMRMAWDSDAIHFYNIKSAAEWAGWEHASAFWVRELAEQEQEEQNLNLPASGDPVPVEDDGRVDEILEDAEQPAQEVVAATRLGDPRLESVRAAYYAQRGAYSWPVRILVQPHNERSWVIQKVHSKGPDGEETFWEAFPVGSDKSEADFQDIYMSPVSGKMSGTRTVRGLMQHFVFAGGANPPGMSIAGSEGADREGFSTTTVPTFWEDLGTPHDLDITWGAFGTTVTTIPVSETPRQKDLQQL